MHLIASFVTIIAQFSELESKKPSKYLNGDTKHQGINGYFCDNVVYLGIFYYCFHDSHLQTTKLSCLEDGYVLCLLVVIIIKKNDVP